jgi:hypothetical protein
MTQSNVGTCGNCGGAVTVPTVWLGVVPPTPTCQCCGATPKDAHGLVREMNPPSQRDRLLTAGERFEEMRDSEPGVARWRR